MAPRGSQLVISIVVVVYAADLDPWLHEGANEAIKQAYEKATDLDPWLHEGANV